MVVVGAARRAKSISRYGGSLFTTSVVVVASKCVCAVTAATPAAPFERRPDSGGAEVVPVAVWLCVFNPPSVPLVDAMYG